MGPEQQAANPDHRDPSVTWIDDEQPAMACPCCAAPLPRGLTACPSCEVHVVGVAVAGPLRPPRRIGIGAGMVVIAAAAVCFATFRLSILLGLFFTVTVTIALIRTYAGLARSAAIDWPLDRLDKLALFAQSFVIAIAMVIGSGIAFWVGAAAVGSVFVCGGVKSWGIVMGLIAGVLAAAFTANRMRLVLWPIRFR